MALLSFLSETSLFTRFLQSTTTRVLQELGREERGERGRVREMLVDGEGVVCALSCLFYYKDMYSISNLTPKAMS